MLSRLCRRFCNRHFYRNDLRRKTGNRLFASENHISSKWERNCKQTFRSRLRSNYDERTRQPRPGQNRFYSFKKKKNQPSDEDRSKCRTRRILLNRKRPKDQYDRVQRFSRISQKRNPGKNPKN